MKVLSDLGVSDEVWISLKAREKTLEDSYFVDRKLYPNVDFIQESFIEALGIPIEMLPPCLPWEDSQLIAQWRKCACVRSLMAVQGRYILEKP